MAKDTAADVALRNALNAFLWEFGQKAAEPKTGALDRRKGGPKHPYIRLVNRSTEKLIKAFRVAARRHVTDLPGRAQAGAIDTALRAAAPEIKQKLR